MRLLVTGATGFIGRHLVRRLAAEGHTVLSCSRSPTGPAEAAQHVHHDFAWGTLLPQMGPVDAVIHLAGASAVLDAQEDPARVAQVNVQGTLTALLFAREHGARFLLASSQRVYRPSPEALPEDAAKEPRDLYGYTKLAAELYVEMACRLDGVPAVVTRFFSVYGPGQVISRGTSGVVSILAQRAITGRPMVVMTREPKDFVEVSDVVEGITLALAACRSPAPAYNIAAGSPTTVLELATLLKRVAGSDSTIAEEYADEPGGLVANIDRARRELGYEPRVSLEEGLRTYVSWLSASGANPAQGTPHPHPAR